MTLKSDIDSDLTDVFFKQGANEFEDDVTYTAAGEAAVTITGYFDENPVEDDGEAIIGDGSSQPTFECASTQVPNAARGDLLTRNGVNYTVALVPKPQDGITTLILEIA